MEQQDEPSARSLEVVVEPKEPEALVDGPRMAALEATALAA